MKAIELSAAHKPSPMVFGKPSQVTQRKENINKIAFMFIMGGLASA
jgi:hypothetical protein